MKKCNDYFLMRLLWVLLAFGLSCQTVFAKDIHYVGPNLELKCMKIDAYQSAAPIDEAWFFCLEADQISTDPDRPPIVLGDSGPWTVTEVNQDPSGNIMPFIGLKFTLDPGGNPATSGALFTHPTIVMPPGTNFTIVEFWHEVGGDYSTNTGYPVDVYVTIPPEMTDPYVIAQHIWDHRENVIPTLSEWGVIILFLLVVAIGMVFLYQRKTALAIAGVSESSTAKPKLFDGKLFAKVFAVVLLIGAVGLVAAYLYFGSVTSADPFGVVVSSGIVAYMVQLWLLKKS